MDSRTFRDYSDFAPGVVQNSRGQSPYYPLKSITSQPFNLKTFIAKTILHRSLRSLTYLVKKEKIMSRISNQKKHNHTMNYHKYYTIIDNVFHMTLMKINDILATVLMFKRSTFCDPKQSHLNLRQLNLRKRGHSLQYLRTSHIRNAVTIIILFVYFLITIATICVTHVSKQ